MKKSDLQNGMIVECENGTRYMVVRNFNEYTPILSGETRDVLMGIDKDSNYMPLSKYNEDLRLNTKDIFGYNIAKVGYPKHICCPIDTYVEWIWEQKRKANLTEDEKAILRSANKCFKYIARDNGGLMFFEDKPRLVVYEDESNKDCWITWVSRFGYTASLKPFNHLFAFIKNEDTEPYNIDELLKANGVER